MSLVNTSYALNLRNIRFTKNAKTNLDLSEFSINQQGLLDITDYETLESLSQKLTSLVDDDWERLSFTPANLNMLAISEMVKLTVIDNLSKAAEKDLFIEIEDLVKNNNSAVHNILQTKFRNDYFVDDEKPQFTDVLRYWFSRNNPAHQYANKLLAYESTVVSDDITKYGTTLTTIQDDLPQIEKKPFFDFLLEPEELFPDSLSGQLQYMSESWAKYIDGSDLTFLLMALDLLNEEEKTRLGGRGPTQVLEFGRYGDDYEKFTPDEYWMPRMVLISKNILVWLNQLSKKYNRLISKLNEIPDEELNILQERGITGLWLVGLWERSTASKRIKNIMNNPEAVSSAYAIYDYQIAENLGGDDALQNLKSRLEERNIRIGADMVPNHTGIDSRWVIEHPDWFINTKESPFSAYKFESENLSHDERVSIVLEDHYYDHSDAAVVFKRIDNNTGDTHYIYHGNDGTKFPWNDTAQLDFLSSEVREGVINTILEVAKKFSIIRFDAAMVLAKQHIRRLWYPKPGEGGDIPSRSRFAMSDEDFDALIPNEFWREVVDRINQEAPDTLLLAEAFWLLEGYFVRTLGMHRVYNSAFMNMLKDEENSKYRQTVKNVLEYNPEILKRFVNYLTTPDEDPAIIQFGENDKYFGICTMMATMPGLPLFGHGQFEGFSEKYGMEYAKAYYNETENQYLIDRHNREIVPLLNRRYLFAESENFFLFDFYNNDGAVNENVFAYSNRIHNEKALVVYNNKYEEAHGWVKTSAAYIDDNNELVQNPVDIAMDLIHSKGYIIFRDHVSGLDYIRSLEEVRDKGMFVSIGAFKYHVFLDFEEITEDLSIWSEIYLDLNGQGINNIRKEFRIRKYPGENFDNEDTPSISVEEVNVTEVDSLEAQDEDDEEEDEWISALEDGSKGKIDEETVEDLKELYDEEISKDKPTTQSEVVAKTQDRSKLEKENLAFRAQIKEYEEQLTVYQEDLDKYKGENQSLEKKINILEKSLIDLEAKYQQLTEDNQALQSNLLANIDQKSAKYEEAVSETSLKAQILSSSLMEEIIKVLSTASSGVHLRKLSMTLGISMNVCMRYVRNMEDQNKVSLKYTGVDDSNPLVKLLSA